MSDKNYTPDIFGYIENMKDLDSAASLSGEAGVRMMTSFAVKTATNFAEGCESKASNNLDLNGLIITDMDGNTVDFDVTEGVIELHFSTPTQDESVFRAAISAFEAVVKEDTSRIKELEEALRKCATSPFNHVDWKEILKIANNK